MTEDIPQKEPVKTPRCALGAKLLPKLRNSYAHADQYVFYEDWLSTCRCKLGDEYCENHHRSNMFGKTTRFALLFDVRIRV